MTIDEAIRMLETGLDAKGRVTLNEAYPAVRLGIEVLKRLSVLRDKPYLDPRDKLLGETEE